MEKSSFLGLKFVFFPIWPFLVEIWLIFTRNIAKSTILYSFNYFSQCMNVDPYSGLFCNWERSESPCIGLKQKLLWDFLGLQETQISRVFNQ